MNYRLAALFILFLQSITITKSQTSNLKFQITFVELNCENLFDCRHDEGKEDFEFLPDGDRHWSRTKYWRKLNNIGQELLSCSDNLPDLVALCEVENDTVLHDLTRRSLLRNAGYHYLMTESPDVRGLDVALLYQPMRFRPICYDCITVEPILDMRPTRDILYVRGETVTRDTLHLFIVHAPSRYGGELETRPFRQLVCRTLAEAVSRLEGEKIIVAGDFNDYANDPALRHLEETGLINVTKNVKGTHGAKANYRHDGLWRSLDHVFLSSALYASLDTAYINDLPFLLEEDQRYGGVKPRRTFNGFRYQQGFSDHLPLVVRLQNQN